MNLLEILALPPQERRSKYAVSGNVRKDQYGNFIDIGHVWIKESKFKGDIADDFTDNDKFSNYGTYSFVWQKTLKESPSRMDNGGLPQLRNIPSFITGNLKINFDLISIDDYRRLMKLIYNVKEHCYKVKTYDIVYDRMVIIEMYIQPEEMPTIYAISDGLQQGNNDDIIDLIGVRSHVIQLVGTGNDDAQGRYFG